MQTRHAHLAAQRARVHGARRRVRRPLWIQGEDLLDAAPNQERMAAALDGLDFLVVQDIFLTPTAQLADVVLPSVSGYEKDGTYTNLERRVQRVRRAIPPLAGAKPDWQVFIELAARFGYDLPYPSPEPDYGRDRGGRARLRRDQLSPDREGGAALAGAERRASGNPDLAPGRLRHAERSGAIPPGTRRATERANG